MPPCIGYNQTLGYFQGTIAIKKPVGYLGGLCTNGTEEWVRFYIDHGDKTGWQDLGLAGVNVHDIPNADDCHKDTEKPLYYCVTLAFTPQLLGAEIMQLPRGACYPRHPVLERPTAAGDAGLVSCAIKDPNASILLPDPEAVGFEALASTYGERVAPLRFGFPVLHTAITGSGSQQELLAYHKRWSNLNIDFASALGKLHTFWGDTQYEQLDCLGLEYSLSRLVATFHTKQPYGYSGTLCTAGSTEYVTFWSDWDNTCHWTHLGTIPICGNGMTVKDAKFVFGGTPADPLSGRPCPFAHNIIFQAPSPPGATKYRIWAQPAVNNPPPKFFLKDSFTTFSFVAFKYKTHTPDPNTGWVSYLDNQLENIDAILGIFRSTDNQLWRFQLETDGNFFTPWYFVQMDNLAPSFNVTTTAPGFCGDLPVGGTLEGTFTATDAHFSHWALSVLPSQNVPKVDVIQPASSGTNAVWPSPAKWSMSTKGMQACGYVVRVEAWDLANWNSAAGPGNYAYLDKGFCLTPAGMTGSNDKGEWEVVEEKKKEEE